MNQSINLHVIVVAVGLSAAPWASAALSRDIPLVDMIRNPYYAVAIQQCVMAHPGGSVASMIEIIRPAHRDAGGMITMDASGRRQFCTARKITGEIERVDPLFETNGPLYAPAQNHSGALRGMCTTATPVSRTGKCKAD